MNYGILIYDHVAELDFAGPLQVFGASVKICGEGRVFTVARTKSPVTCACGLKVIPDYSFDDTPEMDVLVIPGAEDVQQTAINVPLLPGPRRRLPKAADL